MDVDKYGNATTNLTADDLDKLSLQPGQSARVTVRNTTIQMPFKTTYGNVSKGAPVLLLYEGLVQLAINEAHFSRKFEVTRGSEVSIER